MKKIALGFCALAAVVSLASGVKLGAQTPAAKPGAPPVMPMVPEEVDYWAVRLAKQVQKGGKDALPALDAAFQAAGFGVRQKDGQITQSDKPGQFMIVNRTELEAMVSMSAKRMNLPLAGLVAGLGKVLPGVPPADLNDLLLDGIRKNATNPRVCMRFWALFIVELGRQSEMPYDLLGKVDPAQVRFDAVQAALILRRLSRDLLIMAVKAKEQS